jgi:putative MATE family efflux protein
MSGAALQASGDVMTPLKATTITRVVHIAITPFLMFGWLFFPELQLAGAAWANVVSQLAGAALNFYALFNGSGRLHLTLKGYRVDFPLLKRMIVIGAPASATGTERAISQVVLLYIVSPFGTVAQAAYALARRVEMFANFGSMGFAQASGIMVGQNLGAKRPDRAKKSLQWALAFVGGFKFIVAIPLFFIPTLFLMIFTDNQEVLTLGSQWLMIMAVTAFFLGWGQVFAQSFNVAGDTITVMLVTLAAVLLVEMPMAWVYSHTLGIGPLGVAWAQLTAMVVRAGLFVPVYYYGRWLRIKVIEGYRMPMGGGGGGH